MAEQSPQITVIVPVYNTARYLPDCLDSILSQSMKDFEILAVNDASTDNSPDILAEYAAKDSRVRIVNHETNKGLLAGRLSGIRAARAESQRENNNLRVVPHRSGYSTLKKTNRDRFPCQWRATNILTESSNAGGLQQQGAPTSCETGVFTKSSARTRFFD